MPSNLETGTGGQASIKKAGHTHNDQQGDNPFAQRKSGDAVKDLTVDTKR
jgi:hypothetical protein